ncbi:heterokaryon incompatibility protein [Colletotrichum sojae]|uniref:Heterokaryon incompatibility protein n=1 Tax=Colletotrichum sojae TaxID=2175907 RepID=A0A8H6JI78_9PEZI|nr:heterokaryon incompatibility protein [Colletotrichum sojae]
MCPERLQDSTSSKQTLDQALAWYEKYISSHEECERSAIAITERDGLPTRLVDVGVEGDEDWRLVLSAEVVNPRHTTYPLYMTLSYRWGSNPRLLLLSSTMEYFRRGKPIDDLPQTFRDFIKVARHFNVRYVWIDCICIIQDSIDDWEREAPTMASVYSNAACNIAAAVASGPEQGLFTSREPLDPRDKIVAAAISSADATSYYPLVNSNRHFAEQFESSNLKQRGWVFQEWFLSPRVLHFTRDETIWECCDGAMKSELFPSHQLAWDAKSDKISGKSLRAQLGWVPGGSESPESMSDQCLDIWIRQVERYFGCCLTDPRDKLFAVSGVAKRFMGACGDTYYAGMWRTKLSHQLCWKADTPQPRPICGYRAPSWSWMSVDGMTEIEKVKEFNWTYWADVADAKVITKTDDCTVGVTGGFLGARGCALSVKYDRYTKKGKGGKHRITFDEKCWLRVELFPDATEDEFGETGCLQLLVLQTLVLLKPHRRDNVVWLAGGKSLNAGRNSGPSSQKIDSKMTSADDNARGPNDESTKTVEKGVELVSEEDALNVKYNVCEGFKCCREDLEDHFSLDDGQASQIECLICKMTLTDFHYHVPITSCLILEPVRAVEGAGEDTYRRVGLLMTYSDACGRHMLQEIIRQSPREVVLI